jgi:diguanylate cyclase (GGDEF)-like protein
VLSWLVSGLVLVGCTGCAAGVGSAHPFAVAGVADLDGLEAGSPRRVLEGEWAFFDRTFLDPAALAAGTELSAPTHLVEIPSYWNRLPVDGGARHGGHGYGSYLLELTNVPERSDLGLMLKYACTSYRLFVVQPGRPPPIEPVLESGTVAARRSAAVPGHHPQLGPIGAVGGPLYLLVHVSNFAHRGGGLCAPPVLDEHANLRHRYHLKRTFDAAIVGMLAVLTLYNLSMFRQRPEERASLWLAALAGVVLVRMLAAEAFFELFAGGSSALLFEWSYKSEYLAIPLGCIAMAHFFRHTFPDHLGPSLARFTLWPGLTLVAFTLVTPLPLYSRFVHVYLAFLVLCILYGAVQLVRAWRAGAPHAATVCVGCIPVIAASCYDSAVAESVTYSVYLLPYSMILFIYTQGRVVANRFSDALATSQRLSDDLEDEVGRQTVELRRRTEELERAQRELEILASTDALTGVGNRLSFEQEYAREWRRARRHRRPLAVLLIDVDHFKAINDRHGHIAGDRCLQAVARALAQSARRPADRLARYGGEEFVLVLAETEVDRALAVAERILETVRGLGVDDEGEPIPLFVSIGVAAGVPGEDDEERALLAAADRALYRAKGEGRDRAVVEAVIEPQRAVETD